MRKLPSFALLFLILQARPAEKFALTIDNIMRGPNLVGYEPSQVRWSGDSRQVFFQWKQAAQKEDAPLDTYVVERDGSGLRKLSDDEAKLAPPPAGEPTRDHRLITYARDGDIFVYDTASAKTQQVTKTTDPETNPGFLRDGKRIFFTRANNLYVMSLDGGMLVQMTDIRPAIPAIPPATGPTAGRGGRGAARARGGDDRAAPRVPCFDTRFGGAVDCLTAREAP